MSLKDFWNNGIDFEEIDEHYKTIFRLLLFIALLFLFKDTIIKIFNPYEQNKETLKHDYEKEYSGTVVKLGKNKRTRNQPYFQFKDSVKIFDHRYDVSPKIAVGDSVLKKKNSMLLYIYKPDTTIIINYEDIYKSRDSIIRSGHY